MFVPNYTRLRPSTTSHLLSYEFWWAFSRDKLFPMSSLRHKNSSIVVNITLGSNATTSCMVATNVAHNKCTLLYNDNFSL